MKILYFVTRFCIGGGTEQALRLASIFNDGEHKAFIVGGQNEAYDIDVTNVSEPQPYEYFRLRHMIRSVNPLKDILAIYEAIKIIKRIKPDVVHTHTAKAGLVGRIAAFLCGVPVIVHTFHGNNFSGYFGKAMNFISITIEKCLALISTEIVSICEQQKEELLKYKITRAEKISVIPLGFDFKPLAADVKGLRTIYRLAEQTKIIAFIGRVAKIKNLSLFVEIAAQVREKYEDVVFFVVGDGEDIENTKNKVEAMNLKDKFIFTGFLDNLAPVYADIDVSVLTSINEGTPVTVFEAMYYKKLTVASNVGGVADVISNGQDGFYYNLDEPEKCVEYILAYLLSPQKYSSLPENGYRKVTTEYTLEKLKERHKKIYGLY